LLWSEEWLLIRAAALAHGVDAFFIAAIRKAENGAPGREFGVLSVHAPTYADQLRECCATVRRRMSEKPPRMGLRILRNGVVRLILPNDWIDWFGSRWAPLGAENDPLALNRNWSDNVVLLYAEGMNNGGS
jgi:hypothetical protein